MSFRTWHCNVHEIPITYVCSIDYRYIFNRESIIYYCKIRDRYCRYLNHLLISQIRDIINNRVWFKRTDVSDVCKIKVSIKNCIWVKSRMDPDMNLFNRSYSKKMVNPSCRVTVKLLLLVRSLSFGKFSEFWPLMDGLNKRSMSVRIYYYSLVPLFSYCKDL